MTEEIINKMADGRVFAVDGDIIAYRTAAVCEEDFEGACSAIIDSTLKEISTATNVNFMRIYLSGSDNFRYNIAKTKPYKGNRLSIVRPQFLDFCNNYLVDKYKALRCNGYEADDGVATDMTINGAIHCGIDKDILQIAGDHYNYVKKEWQTISEEEATIRLYRQILMGDASDNIPGLPKVGEKTAEKVIHCAETAEEDAIAFYKEVCEARLPGVDYIEYMAEQMNLIKMVKDAKVTFEHTVYIEPNTEGFENQDGTFEGSFNDKPRSVKL